MYLEQAYFIIVRPAAEAQVGKQLLFMLSQPHKHLHHLKLKKTQLMEATNGWLHPWPHHWLTLYVANAESAWSGREIDNAQG